jgi:hypothetical protein
MPTPPAAVQKTGRRTVVFCAFDSYTPCQATGASWSALRRPKAGS